MSAKNLFSAIIALAVFLSCNSASENKNEWNLVWEENFNGKTIDTVVWSKIPRGISDWNNYMSDFDGLYAVENGNLILRGISNTVLPHDTAPFLTGGVFTKDKKEFGFGRLEIRAKLNGAIGAWPAFWMLPSSGKWPSAGEIDIMERLNYDKYVYQTVHSSYTDSLDITDNPVSGVVATFKSNDYNVFAVEKYPDSLVFFVNNTRTKTYPKIDYEEVDQFPYAKQNFYLLLDMQLGGRWVGAVNAQDLPVEMQIDWVRFYEKNSTVAKEK